MEKNIFKRILLPIKDGLLSFLRWIKKNRQPLIYGFLLINAIIYFAYTLGYTTNWALVISETRGGRFYYASQMANRMMAQIGFILVLVVLINMSFGSLKRKKFYLSNIVLSILSSILMIVSACLTLYYNSVLRPMYEAISEEEVPAYLYKTHGAGEKSYKVFEIGNILSIFMFLSAILVFIFVFYKLKAQKERAILIEKLVTSNEY